MGRNMQKAWDEFRAKRHYFGGDIPQDPFEVPQDPFEEEQETTQRVSGLDIDREAIGPCTYFDSADRYVISFVASAPEFCKHGDRVVNGPHHALSLAIGYCTDEDSDATFWNVYDRETNVLHVIKLGDVRHGRGEPA